MLTKELELVRVSGERTKDELEGTETAIRDLENYSSNRRSGS